jgi:uncharacterized protein YecT (DUF1311 family)
MTIQRAKELMEIERKCVKRNEAGCNRDCAKCDLAQQTNELIAAYDKVISYINSASKFYGG